MVTGGGWGLKTTRTGCLCSCDQPKLSVLAQSAVLLFHVFPTNVCLPQLVNIEKLISWSPTRTCHIDTSQWSYGNRLATLWYQHCYQKQWVKHDHLRETQNQTSACYHGMRFHHVIRCLLWHGRCLVSFGVAQINVQMDALPSCKFLITHVCLNNSTMENCCPAVSPSIFQSLHLHEPRAMIVSLPYCVFKGQNVYWLFLRCIHARQLKFLVGLNCTCLANSSTHIFFKLWLLGR